jgi:hypothetical protein
VVLLADEGRHVCESSPGFLGVRVSIRSVPEAARSELRTLQGPHTFADILGMAVFAVALIALATVACSFAFATFVVVRVQPAQPRSRGADATQQVVLDGGASATISRVIADVEQLVALRERGVLTDKEFAAQKAKLLQSPPPSRSRKRPTQTALPEASVAQ